MPGNRFSAINNGLVAAHGFSARQSKTVVVPGGTVVVQEKGYMPRKVLVPENGVGAKSMALVCG